ncbi:acetyl-CoA synthetase-like protein [Hypoxylon fragiforme]|uniref:acetyl-CoA synthetase-like protein n=1 Tax=Hypoxylon fragiforme TaxID=63214 RepID=UPI0020C6158E|nr:acetyl-CoA synthetase-like protein [Hypoxylon fragiforme]KAI2613578.1 acetyl-CoA synthetase-like protein [Hypoxylon fragiforme]
MAHKKDIKLVPDEIDEIAATEPESIYGKYPADTSNYNAGFRSITFRQLANAINGVSRWLESEIGRGDAERTPTIAYIGPSDFRYVFTFVGAIKAGYKMFFTSPRNSLVAHLALLESLECTEIIVARSVPPYVDEILQRRTMRVLRIEEMEHYLGHTYDPYPYETTLEKAKGTGAFVCHTSGTTGLPKPCIYTHEFILRAARSALLPPPPGYTQTQLGHNTHILVLPLFHPAGVNFTIINAIYNRCVVIIPSWTSPPTIESLLAISQNVEADWAMTAPFTLEALAKDEAMLDQVASRLKMLVFGGGNLPKKLGDAIAKKIRLASSLGSSETAGLPILHPDGFDTSDNWEYMSFHPQVGAVLEPRTDDSFELVLEKTASTLPYQPVFDRFPELEKFYTGDLFKQHPTRPDMWAHSSRADDIIVFLNGEKTNPVSYENHLSQHRDIEGAVVFGSQRFEAGVLIELKDKRILSPRDTQDHIERIWPTIEQANQECPAHAKIDRSHILFSKPEKPFLRTAKGTVKKKATLELYAEEINRLYQDIESVGPSTSMESKIDLNDFEAVLDVVRTACRESTTLGEIDVNDDMLALGMDSLQILHLYRSIRSKTNVEALKPTTIYENPTPAALARAIQKAAKGDSQQVDEKEKRRARLEETLANFTRRIDQIASTLSSETTTDRKQEKGTETSHVCIITGTTGTIGSYILRALMSNPNISSIYCLNRGPPSSSATRQLTHNAATDPTLPLSFPPHVHFLEADLSQALFGLPPDIFNKLSATATLIIHSAWSVDFNLPLPAFAPHLEGAANLCQFCCCCRARGRATKPRLVFLSSVAAVMESLARPVPEAIPDALSAAPAAGYAESKHVAERVLQHAAEKLRIDVCVARVGQVCGAARSAGRWNGREWIPRLVAGSVRLGVVPEGLGAYGAKGVRDVDWIPVDVLADVVVEIALQGQGQRQGVEVYNLVNPRRTTWAKLLPAVLDAVRDVRRGSDGDGSSDDGEAAPLLVVSHAEWLRKLRDAANDNNSLEAHQQQQEEDSLAGGNPALKLLDFYEQKLAAKVFPEFEIAAAVAASATLRGAAAISPEDMGKWVRLWFKDGTGRF